MSLQTPRNAVQSFGNRNGYEMALKCFSFFLEIQDPISETFQFFLETHDPISKTFQYFWKRSVLFMKHFGHF